MNRQLDVLFVSPDSSFQAYQALSKDFSAIEPPTWALLLAQSCRAKGFGVGDSRLRRGASERRGIRQAHRGSQSAPGLLGRLWPEPEFRHDQHDRRHCALPDTQGSNIPSTPSVSSARTPAPCPTKCSRWTAWIFVLLNEGVYALHNLLRTDLHSDLAKVKGIGYKQDGVPVLNPPERVVPQERMDVDLPGYAWDLLPYRQQAARLISRPLLARGVQPQPAHPVRRHLHVARLQVQVRLLHDQHRQPC